jgi:ketosteroid isomerase-like protein
MSAERERIKELSVEFAKGNIAAVEPYLADDVRWHVLGEETLAGRAAVIELTRMAQLQSFPKIAIKNVVCEGNFVVVESTGEALTKAGKPYNQTYCEVFRFEGTTIHEITTYLDTALSQQALS